MKFLARRFLVTLGFAAALLAAASSVPVMAQRPPGQANNPSFGPIKVNQITPTVYFVQGGARGNNGNSGVIIGKDGVIVIDAKLNEDGAKQMLDEIHKITSKPVTTLIFTHSHLDHVGGAAAFPAGVTVIAHENCKAEIEKAIAAGGPNAPPREAIPTQVVHGSGETLTIDGVRLRLIHVAPAHTTGDLAIWLPAQKILFTGDLMATTLKRPLVCPNACTVAGYVKSYKVLTALNARNVVPGHGVLITNEQLEERAKYVSDTLAKVKQLVAEGKTLPEIEQAMGDAPSEAGPGGAVRIPPFSEVVYNEVTKSK